MQASQAASQAAFYGKLLSSSVELQHQLKKTHTHILFVHRPLSRSFEGKRRCHVDPS